MRGIVCADHQGDKLGGKPVELSILKTPEHVLSAVSAEAEIQHLVRSQRLRVASLLFPEVGDRVPDHDKVNLPRLARFDFS